jgi:hypothetical protein
MDLSLSTIETRREIIFDKIEVSNLTGLVVFAIRPDLSILARHYIIPKPETFIVT